MNEPCPTCGTVDPPRRVVRDASGGEVVTLAADVMERVLGRPLRNGERVHWRDGDSRNNCRANLVLCAPPPRVVEFDGKRYEVGEVLHGHDRGDDCPPGVSLLDEDERELVMRALARETGFLAAAGNAEDSGLCQRLQDRLMAEKMADHGLR